MPAVALADRPPARVPHKANCDSSSMCPGRRLAHQAGALDLPRSPVVVDPTSARQLAAVRWVALRPNSCRTVVASGPGSVIVPEGESDQERESDQGPVTAGTELTIARTDGKTLLIIDRTESKTGRNSMINGGTEDRRCANRRATTVMVAATGTAMISGGHIPIPAGGTVLA